jgi:hypothetical protein
LDALFANGQPHRLSGQTRLGAADCGPTWRTCRGCCASRERRLGFCESKEIAPEVPNSWGQLIGGNISIAGLVAGQRHSDRIEPVSRHGISTHAYCLRLAHEKEATGGESWGFLGLALVLRTMKSVTAQKQPRPNKTVACPQTMRATVRGIRAIVGANAYGFVGPPQTFSNQAINIAEQNHEEAGQRLGCVAVMARRPGPSTTLAPSTLDYPLLISIKWGTR